MITVKKAELSATAVNSKQYPEGLRPEFCMVGRSNVGKSSLINKFLNRKNLARTSSSPGKTRTVNFYGVNDEWFLVDLPGYGYAKTSKEDKAFWAGFIEDYLHDRNQIAGVIQLVDIRHDPMESDKDMVEWIKHYELPLLIVATKADKISKGKYKPTMDKIRKEFKLSSEDKVIAFSSETGYGLNDLHSWLESQMDFYSAKISSLGLNTKED